jgi:hypothetical protein
VRINGIRELAKTFADTPAKGSLPAAAATPASPRTPSTS